MSSEQALNEAERRALLELARATIDARINGEALSDSEKTSPEAQEISLKAGAFVSLHKKGALRGCIGTFDTTQEVSKQIREMAVAASTRDPRFAPVTADELEDIHIEISVLTPPRPIESIEEIIVGEHGIVISRGYQRGVLLPQVATEYGWDRETFLRHTCRKAGLDLDAWKDSDTEIEIFRAIVFGEKERS